MNYKLLKKAKKIKDEFQKKNDINAFILADKGNIPGSSDIHMAYEGLLELNANVKFIGNSEIYTEYAQQLVKSDLFVGGVKESLFVLSHLLNDDLRKYLIYNSYPKELEKFLMRKVEKVKMGVALSKIGKEPFFLKPEAPKSFQALVVKSAEDVIQFMHIDEDANVLISEVCEFKSEWRVYVCENKVESIHYYSGKWDTFPNTVTIRQMVEAYKNSPICYGLDVGVVKGKTVLVEVNDFYSIGNYGLAFHRYARMLLMRWKEILSKKKILR